MDPAILSSAAATPPTLRNMSCTWIRRRNPVCHTPSIETILCNIVQYCAILCKMCNTVQCCAILYKTVQDCTKLCNAVQTLLYCESCTILYKTVQYCTRLCKTVQYCTNSTIQCKTVQDCAIACKTVQDCANLNPSAKSTHPIFWSKNCSLQSRREHVLQRAGSRIVCARRLPSTARRRGRRGWGRQCWP